MIDLTDPLPTKARADAYALMTPALKKLLAPTVIEEPSAQFWVSACKWRAGEEQILRHHGFADRTAAEAYKQQMQAESDLVVCLTDKRPPGVRVQARKSKPKRARK